MRVGDELWIYYSGRSTDHRSRPHVGAIGLGTLRLDGFFSLDAGENPGVLTTKLLKLQNQSLRLNANAEQGELRVGIIDAHGEPVEPYTIQNCAPLTTDNVRHQVQWRGAQNLKPILGRTVRLQFEFTNAELYAVWTGEVRTWATPDTRTWLR